HRRGQGVGSLLAVESVLRGHPQEHSLARESVRQIGLGLQLSQRDLWNGPVRRAVTNSQQALRRERRRYYRIADLQVDLTLDHGLSGACAECLKRQRPEPRVSGDSLQGRLAAHQVVDVKVAYASGGTAEPWQRLLPLSGNQNAP